MVFAISGPEGRFFPLLSRPGQLLYRAKGKTGAGMSRFRKFFANLARSGKPEAQAQRALETIAARRYPEAWADEPCIRIAWGLGIAGKTLAWSSRILD